MPTELTLEVQADAVAATPNTHRTVSVRLEGVPLADVVQALKDDVGARELLAEWDDDGELFDILGEDAAVAHFKLELAE